MALPTRTFTLAAAAALIALGGASAVSSAPSPVPAKPMTVSDDAFRPGMDGIDRDHRAERLGRRQAAGLRRPGAKRRSAPLLILHASPRFTIIASGDGILPRNAR
jgi:hypothetical protein